MNPQITQMDADSKLVEFDGVGCEINRVEFEAVGNYAEFAIIGKEGF